MWLDLHDEWEAKARQLAGFGSQPNDELALTEPNDIDLNIAAVDAAYVTVSEKLKGLFESKDVRDNADYEALTQSARDQLVRLLRTRETDARAIWERVADKQIAHHRWLLPKTGERYRAFIHMISEAGLEALRIGIDQRQNPSAIPTSRVVVQGLKAAQAVAAPGETLMALFDRYATQRAAEKRKRTDTIAQDRKVIEQFSNFVGPQRSVRAIQSTDVRDWRDIVSSLPPNWSKSGTYRNKTLREAAAHAKERGAQPLSATTVNKYLSTLSPLFAWARTNSYADINPCDGLFLDVRKGSNPRPPFSDEQLTKIFSSPLFTGFERDGREHKPGDAKAVDWRYWIPVICLFTGARIGEIAQLQIGDVRYEHGVPVIHIRNDASTGQSTKSGYSRVAPVHSGLVKLGFLQFVDGQREQKEGNAQLFPQLKPNDRGHIGWKPSKFWRSYLGKIGIKDGGDGFGAHSFRHTLADKLRLAGFLDDEIEVALGHNQKTVTSGYGIVRQGTVKKLTDMIESVSFTCCFEGR